MPSQYDEKYIIQNALSSYQAELKPIRAAAGKELGDETIPLAVKVKNELVRRAVC